MQTGWGRTGEHFWGWQAHAEHGPPDILTFAKGIGNGMSIGGVVARAEVMNCLDANSISTFGGHPSPWRPASPTSRTSWSTTSRATRGASAGCSSSGCGRSRAGSDAVREVRGRGLMIGIELVKPGTDEAHPEAAAAVLEAARAGGLLIGKGGGHNTSVLRIAPPLSLTVAEAEEGAAILADALHAAD